MVGIPDLTRSRVGFLKFCVAFRSGEMVKTLLRASDPTYDNKKLNPQQFTLAKFRRNLDRMDIIRAAESETDLCPGDLVKLYGYKTLISSGLKLTTTVTNRFPK